MHDESKLEKLRRRATEGDPPSIYILAQMYHHGDVDVPIDKGLAKELYEKAAPRYVPALYELAMMHYEGDGIAENKPEALRLLKQGVSRRSRDSKYQLGLMYLEGVVVKEDQAEGIKLIIDAASMDFGPAISFLKDRKLIASLIQSRVPKNVAVALKSSSRILGSLDSSYSEMTEALQLLSDLAEFHADAMVELARYYLHGCSTDRVRPYEFRIAKDPDRARELLKRAAEKEHGFACYMLGNILSDGTDVQQDYARAVDLYKVAGNKGIARAMSRIGQLYEEGGHGLCQDLEAARMWYESAIRRADSLAMYRLGRLHYFGIIDPNDKTLGLSLIKRAAHDQHCIDALLCVEEISVENAYSEDAVILDARCCFLLSRRYTYSSDQVEKNPEKANRYLQQAADLGDTMAQRELRLRIPFAQFQQAEYLRRRSDWKSQKDRIIELYESAIREGYVDGLPLVARFYYFQVKDQRSKERARELLQLAYDRSHIWGDDLTLLGLLYLENIGSGADFEKAFQLLKKAADRRHADAQYRIGLMYFHGKGVLQDYLLAKEWFEKAANQGHANAQFSLGSMCFFGNGVPQDYLLAKEWFEKAANQEHANAQFSLGSMYFYGNGVPQDYLLAKEWFEKAANQGHANAQFSLGLMYFHGKGVLQDYLLAKEWFEKATAQNNFGAMYYLALILKRGKVGNEPVIEESNTWLSCLKTAANSGVAVAQYWQAYWYILVEDKPLDGYTWSLIAIKNGVRQSDFKLDELEGKLTAEQISEAKRLAAEWKPIDEK